MSRGLLQDEYYDCNIGVAWVIHHWEPQSVFGVWSGLGDTKEAWSLLSPNQTEQISLQESWHSACSERLPTGKQNFWTHRPWHRLNFFLSSVVVLGMLLSLTTGGGLVAGFLSRLLIRFLFGFLLTEDDGLGRESGTAVTGNRMLVCLVFSRDFWDLWWGTWGTAGMMVNLWGSIIKYMSLMSVLSTNNGLNILLLAAGES